MYFDDFSICYKVIIKLELVNIINQYFIYWKVKIKNDKIRDKDVFYIIRLLKLTQNFEIIKGKDFDI